MDNVIPIQLEQHYTRPVIATAYLWLLKRQDGFELGLTSLDRELKVGDMWYHAGGFDPTAKRSTADLSVDSMDVNGILDPKDLYITREDVVYGRWDNTEVYLMRLNWRRPNDGWEVIGRGNTGEVQTTDQFRAELRGLGQYLQQTLGWSYTPACNHTLGDRMCGVDLSLYRFEGAVTAVSDRQDAIVSTSLVALPGVFSAGTLLVLSGRNAGFRSEIKDSFIGSLTMQECMPWPFAVGDTYRLTRGCDKILGGDCEKVYNNTINHGGFAHLPGRDKVAELTGGAG